MSADTAPDALRAYADKYHPEPEQFPEITRELDRIFSGVTSGQPEPFYSGVK